MGFLVVDDTDDTTSIDKMSHDESNKTAYGNTADQAV